MRHTTRLALFCPILLAACVEQPPRPRHDDTDPKCSSPEEVHEDRTITKAEDFDGLPSGCWDLYGTLTFSGSEITSLADFDRLANMAGANHLVIKNTKLTTLDMADSLYVYGRVDVENNDLLTSLEGITVDQQEALDIIVSNNAALTDLGTLTDVTKIGGFDASGNIAGGILKITDNAKLANIKFDSLKEVYGGVTIRNNAALTTVDLSLLEYLHGDLTFTTNPKLTKIEPLTGLVDYLGSVTVIDNDALPSLGLFSPTSAHVTGLGGLTIKDNAVLANLGQTSHLQGLTVISITGNPALPACLAQEVSTCVPHSGSATTSGNQGTATNCDFWCN